MWQQSLRAFRLSKNPTKREYDLIRTQLQACDFDRLLRQKFSADCSWLKAIAMANNTNMLPFAVNSVMHRCKEEASWVGALWTLQQMISRYPFAVKDTHCQWTAKILANSQNEDRPETDSVAMSERLVGLLQAANKLQLGSTVMDSMILKQCCRSRHPTAWAQALHSIMVHPQAQRRFIDSRDLAHLMQRVLPQLGRGTSPHSSPSSELELQSSSFTQQPWEKALLLLSGVASRQGNNLPLQWSGYNIALFCAFLRDAVPEKARRLLVDPWLDHIGAYFSKLPYAQREEVDSVPLVKLASHWHAALRFWESLGSSRWDRILAFQLVMDRVVTGGADSKVALAIWARYRSTSVLKEEASEVLGSTAKYQVSERALVSLARALRKDPDAFRLFRASPYIAASPFLSLEVLDVGDDAAPKTIGTAAKK